MLIMNNIYDLQNIGKRIKAERTNLKLSQQEFADKLNISARQTISKWEKGIAIPQLEDMLNMCNLFNCELGYLLGEYDCKTRINTDIAKETGLTEKSIYTLHSLLVKSTSEPENDFDTEVARADIILRTVNHLLNYAEFWIEDSLLGLISLYLYGDFTHFYTDTVANTEDLYYDISELGLWDMTHGIENTFNIHKLMNVILTDIQQKLQEERDHLQFDFQEPFKRLTPVSKSKPISIEEYMADLKSELAYLEELPNNEINDLKNKIDNIEKVSKLFQPNETNSKTTT